MISILSFMKRMYLWLLKVLDDQVRRNVCLLLFRPYLAKSAPPHEARTCIRQMDSRELLDEESSSLNCCVWREAFLMLWRKQASVSYCSC